MFLCGLSNLVGRGVGCFGGGFGLVTSLFYVFELLGLHVVVRLCVCCCLTLV